MKKNLFMVAAVALVALVSCNKETNSSLQPAPVSDIKFEAEIAQTKTSIGAADENGYRNVTWDLGEQVYINGSLFTATDKKEDGKAIFETENLDFTVAEQYDAIYPATAGKSLEAVTIPTEQDGTFANAAIAVAQSENRSLSFLNVASLLRFQVPASYASVTIESTANLAGTVSVSFDEEGLPVVGEVKNASKTITLKNVKADVDYYVAILPGDHKFTVNIDGRLSKEASNTLTATRAGILALGVLPKPAKLDRNLAFSAATATAKVGVAFTAPTLSGVKDGVTYTSSNTAVATINATTGVVTLVAGGETTITASAEATEVYNSGSASYKLTVKAPSAWRLVGKFNKVDKWDINSGSIAMYAVDGQANTYVAEKVTLTADDIWKFNKDDKWDDWVGSYSSSYKDSEVYKTMQNHTSSSNAYGTHHTWGDYKSNFGAAAGTYDIYLYVVASRYGDAKVWVVKK